MLEQWKEKAGRLVYWTHRTDFVDVMVQNGAKDLPYVPCMCACLLGDWGSWKESP